MKHKLVLNTALSVLVALGLAACSGGGSKAVTKTVDKAKDTVTTAKDQVKDKEKKTDEKGVKNVYGATVAFNEHDGSRVLGGAKTLVKYSDANELVIENKKIVVMKKYAFDFMMADGQKYQTVAKYKPADAKDNDNAKASFVTLGYQTLAKDIPNAGSAMYKGKAFGASLVPHAHLQGDVAADVTVNVDFKDKTVAFKTENTLLNNKKEDRLNLTGTAKLDAENNKFVDGEINAGTSGRAYKGTLEGHLYGPKAEEVGGTFNLMEGFFIGGFGAKQK